MGWLGVIWRPKKGGGVWDIAQHGLHPHRPFTWSLIGPAQMMKEADIAAFEGPDLTRNLFSRALDRIIRWYSTAGCGMDVGWRTTESRGSLHQL
jgi:hypothetical protein